MGERGEGKEWKVLMLQHNRKTDWKEWKKGIVECLVFRVYGGRGGSR